MSPVCEQIELTIKMFSNENHSAFLEQPDTNADSKKQK